LGSPEAALSQQQNPEFPDVRGVAERPPQTLLSVGKGCFCSKRAIAFAERFAAHRQVHKREALALLGGEGH
jgi:hypothetical protein